MPEFTAKDVQALRTATGAGMMDCKNALTEASGDIEKAKEVLREKGLADVKKREGRAAAQGLVDAYVHGGGTLGVLVEVNCETDFVARTDEFKTLCHEIALHIASGNPDYVSREDVPEDVAEKERRYYEKQAASSGKPENIIPKIVEGQMNSFYRDRVLLDQVWVKDDKKTIGELVKEAAAKLGENIQVRRFARFKVGA